MAAGAAPAGREEPVSRAETVALEDSVVGLAEVADPEAMRATECRP